METSNIRAYAMLTATAFCWGSNVVLGQLAVGHVSPMALVTLRWLGVLLLIVVFARRSFVEDRQVLVRHLPFLLAMGALGYTVFNAMMYLAAHSTSGLNIGILQGTIPIIVMIGSYLVYRDRFAFRQMLGVAITIVGVLMVVSHGDIAQLVELGVNTGDIYMFIACIFYAGYTVMLRNRPKVSAMGMFTVFAIGALVAAIPLLALEAVWGALVWPTAQGWLVVILVTLLPSFVAQIFFINGVAAIGPARAGVFVNLVPIFAAILVVLILDEDLRWFHVVSLALVFLGIWISEQSGIRRDAREGR